MIYGYSTEDHRRQVVAQKMAEIEVEHYQLATLTRVMAARMRALEELHDELSGTAILT